MKVLVAKSDLKIFNGKEDIFPELGEVIELPDDIATLEMQYGFVTPFELEEKKSVKKAKRKSQIKEH